MEKALEETPDTVSANQKPQTTANEQERAAANAPERAEMNETEQPSFAAADEPEETKKKINWVKEILSWVILIAVAYLLARVITEYVIVKAEIPTGSMENTIQVGDHVIGVRVAYLFSNPKRGDIIIFKFPDNEQEDYVKRIIGLPGETVLIQDGVVTIDGVVLEETYLKDGMSGNYGPYEVPEDSYFVMGDNRSGSWDARFWTNTYVKEDKIVGKVVFRYKPTLGFVK